MDFSDFKRKHDSLVDPEARRRLAASETAALKERYASELRSSAEDALETTELIERIGRLANDPGLIALGLRTRANVLSLGFGRHADALALYQQAEDRYRQTGDDLEIARMRAAQVWPIAVTRGYQPAVSAGDWAYGLLEEHGEWRTLGVLINNLGIVHNYFGEILESLRLYDKAKQTFAELGADGESRLVSTESNRCLVLTFLGRFDEAAAAGKWALRTADKLGMTAVFARALNNLGHCCSVQGQYTAALQYFDRALEIWANEQAHHQHAQVLLTMSYCLLSLRDFRGAADRCREAFRLAVQHDIRPESPFDFLNEVRAHLGQAQFEEALQALARIEEWLPGQAGENMLTKEQVLLLRSELHFLRSDWPAAIDLADACAVEFEASARRIEHAGALLIAARSYFAVGEPGTARLRAEKALALAKEPPVHEQVYQAEALLGRLAQHGNDLEAAFERYAAAIQALAHLQSRTMLELRPDFLEDAEKRGIFSSMVQTCLLLDRPNEAMDFVERARAGALRDLLKHRIDLGIRSRDASDRELVEAFNRDVAHRNALLRKLQAGGISPDTDLQEKIRQTEIAITGHRNRLLIRRADYAASLQFETSDPARPVLDDETILIDFFELAGEYIAICLGKKHKQPEIVRLGTGPELIAGLVEELNLNFATVMAAPPGMIPSLERSARQILREMYRVVMEPIHELVRPYRRLAIVPYGRLHDLPFNALFDGENYLSELHVLSRLPAAGILGLAEGRQAGSGRMLVVGHSGQGRLPFVLEEAEALAAQQASASLLEHEATRQAFMNEAGRFDLVHLAAHAGYHTENPLFSGIELEDGWLTALDVFNLKLDASLVTLSGCRTGVYRLGGGEEMLGLARSFLAAGAHSLLMSSWDVEDRSTSAVMQAFYQAVFNGKGKGAALQLAQRQLIDGEIAHFRHPYFWAPFYLVGETGPIA